MEKHKRRFWSEATTCLLLRDTLDCLDLDLDAAGPSDRSIETTKDSYLSLATTQGYYNHLRILATTTPKRSENWTKDAVLMLARLVTQKKEVLKGSFAQNIQAADKQYK